MNKSLTALGRRELLEYIETLEKSLAAAEREADRWRHGVPIEGDFICPGDLDADKLREELEVVSRGFADMSDACVAVELDLTELHKACIVEYEGKEPRFECKLCGCITPREESIPYHEEECVLSKHWPA